MEENPKAKTINAALILASLKHSKLDNETSSNLHLLKHKFLGQTKVNPLHKTHPKLQISPHNTTQETNLPPVLSLQGLIRNCSKPIQKQLTASDVSGHQNRLALSYKDVKKVFTPLLYPEEDLENGVNVTVYDLQGREYQMCLKIWYPQHSVLIGEWRRFCHENGLKAHEDGVTLWMFRHSYTDKLCFVISTTRWPLNSFNERCIRVKY